MNCCAVAGKKTLARCKRDKKQGRNKQDLKIPGSGCRQNVSTAERYLCNFWQSEALQFATKMLKMRFIEIQLQNS